MSKDNTSLYLDEDVVEQARELDDWESLSALANTLLSAYITGEITLSETGNSDGNTGANTGDELDSLRRRLDDVEDRLDDFEDNGKSLLHDAVRQVNKLDDRVSRLEDLAPDDTP